MTQSSDPIVLFAFRKKWYKNGYFATNKSVLWDFAKSLLFSVRLIDNSSRQNRPRAEARICDNNSPNLAHHFYGKAKDTANFR